MVIIPKKFMIYLEVAYMVFGLLVLLYLWYLHYVNKNTSKSTTGGSGLLTRYQEGFATDPVNPIEPPDVEFPFKNIRDEQHHKLNIIAISAPFRETAHELKYEQYKADGWHLCGLSSYLEFPNEIHNPHEDQFHKDRKHDYPSMVTSWIHCFRDPGYKLQYSGLPLLLMAEADLKNVDHYPLDTTIEKEYDFMYVCLDDNEKCEPGWNWYIRSWDLAKKCLEVMCSKYHLRGIIVGRTNCEFTDKCTGIVKTVPFLPFHEFQTEMQKCRMLFAPNVSDASPRVITEAMLRNLTVLVNRNIVGGWNNVVPGVTGEFFTSEFDIDKALDKLLSPTANYTPREWYINHRGLLNSGKELADFLKEVYPDVNYPDMKYAYI